MTAPVLFTTETIARELDWQLLAASQLASRGIPSFIGKLAALETLAKSATGGLVVGRAFEPAFPGVDLRAYREFRARGFAFVHLDEEGAVFQGDEARWRRTLSRRLDVGVLAADDTVCTWGRFQADHYRSQIKGGSGPEIVVTGHPRFDLYRPELRPYFNDACARVRTITQRPFVLINTNISLANHGQGIAYAFSKRAGYDLEDAARRADHLDYWVYANRVLTGLIKLAHRISVARPDLDVVVRPHPSESHELYDTILGRLPNVRVTRSEVVGAWLAQAVAVIQHGCTTALEAAMGDVLAIDYRVVEDARYDKRLSDAVAWPCRSEDDVLGALANAEALRARQRAESEWARELFANLEGPATPRLVCRIEQLQAQRSGSFDEAAFHRARRWERGWDGVKAVATFASPTHRRMRAYSRSKFPGFHSGALRDRVRQMAEIGLRAPVRILDRDVLEVRPSS